MHHSFSCYSNLPSSDKPFLDKGRKIINLIPTAIISNWINVTTTFLPTDTLKIVVQSHSHVTYHLHLTISLIVGISCPKMVNNYVCTDLHHIPSLLIKIEFNLFARINATKIEMQNHLEWWLS